MVSEIEGEHAELMRPLWLELWDTRRDVGRALDAAARMGAPLVDAGLSASQAVRLVLDGGRALVSLAVADGKLTSEEAPSVARRVDDAAVQVAAAVEEERRRRRQSFLSYLVHELKNPLNTIINALWLIREKGSDPAQAARFLELAEKAVRRLEARAKDVRELDEQLRRPPPGWQAQAGARRPDV
jgi:signal transduction histidine kinase